MATMILLEVAITLKSFATTDKESPCVNKTSCFGVRLLYRNKYIRTIISKIKKQYLNNGLVLSTEMVNCPSSRASLRKTEPPNSLFSICIP